MLDHEVSRRLILTQDLAANWGPATDSVTSLRCRSSCPPRQGSPIAAPLGLDFFIGLPAHERDRVSRMVYQRPAVDLTTVPAESVPENSANRLPRYGIRNRSQQSVNGHTDPAEIDFGSPEVQAAELPASNGIGTAHDLARMYAALIGEVGGTRLVAPETLGSRPRSRPAGRTQ
ncbi:hypothetical protein [Streptomyces sp. NPDC048225]|uniref:hypothetical protein n=1 Tax=Streptomyces sp. NPDC048225 TaxID=3365518 RepID=UPI00371A1FB3